MCWRYRYAILQLILDLGATFIVTMFSTLVRVERSAMLLR